MAWTDVLLLLATGFFAGFINTIAGGGSLVAMPLLIFMGLPSVEANASNRVAIFVQNIFSVQGFRSKGVHMFPFAIYLALPAIAGAIIGANLAVDISGKLFNRILAIVMLMVIVLTVFKPYLTRNRLAENLSKKSRIASIITFFFIGIYGGFIQAGVGFLIIAALTGIHNLGMAKTNSVKVFVILCYTAVALTIFILGDHVRWEYGLILAAGNSVGAWISSRWSVNKDDKWIRWILIFTVSALAIKLWFFG